MNQAFEWEKLILFETDKGLRAYDTSDGNEIQLPQAMAGFSNITQVRNFKEQLWLYHPGSLLILEKNLQAEIKETIFQGIQELVFDKIQQPWARFADGWQVWDSNKFKSPNNENVRLFAAEGESVTGIDKEGYPFVWEDQLVKEDIPLPYQINTDATDSLLHGNIRDWWVLAENHLYHVVRDTCQKTSSQNSDDDKGKSAAKKYCKQVTGSCSQLIAMAYGYIISRILNLTIS